MLIMFSILYALLNIADLVITLFLIDYCEENIEGNPLAHACYCWAGHLGMIMYKVVITVFVTGIVHYIYRKKPMYSYFVFYLGCGILAITIGYSSLLVIILR